MCRSISRLERILLAIRKVAAAGEFPLEELKGWEHVG